MMTLPIVPSASDVRREIFAQHGVLRTFLADAAQTARSAAGGDVAAGRMLFAICARLRSRLERHMAFEEGALVPALRASDPWGIERARRLLEEHVRQRQELSALVQLSQTEAEARTVAFTLQTLISDVLIDMDHEERELLTREVLHDDPIVLDQATD
jgi:hypothetical protein